MKLKYIGWLCLALMLLGFSMPSIAAGQLWRLDNGLEVLVIEDHRAPVVLCSVWYRVGPVNEHNGMTGISHFLEHMMFLGTKRFPGDDFAHQIEKVGGMSNAFTSSDLTVYYEELPKNYLSLALDLESDRMQNLSLSPDLFEIEKNVVKEERRMRVSDNPVGSSVEKLRAATFMNSPYQHPVVGWMTDIDALNIDDVKHWYDHWYAPNNAVLVIVGDVSVKEVRPLVKRYFSQVPEKKVPISKPRQPIGFVGKQQLVLHHPAVKTKMVIQYFSAPQIVKEGGNAQVYALILLDAMLTGDNGSRLDKAWVQDGRWADEVGGSYWPFHFYPTILSLSLVLPQSTNLSKAQESLDHLKFYLQKHPFTEKELSRAKTKVIAQAIYKSDTLMGLASQMAYPLIFSGHLISNAMFSEKIQSVTLSQVQEIEQQIFSVNASSSLWLLPQNMEAK